MKSFKMVFNNSSYIPPSQMTGSKPSVQSASRSASLNAPMIDRVYKAKPGCSACGKKVA